MKLDHDFARVLMLEIESSEEPTGLDEAPAEQLAKANGLNRAQLAYTVDKLQEAGFINGKTHWSGDEPYIVLPGNLTYQGHEYLDTVRSPKIWKESKSVAAKVGTVSLDLMGQIAGSLLSKALGLN